MMLNVYDGAELPRVALDIYQLLLNGALQFAHTILGAARPAVSDESVQARYLFFFSLLGLTHVYIGFVWAKGLGLALPYRLVAQTWRQSGRVP